MAEKKRTTAKKSSAAKKTVTAKNAPAAKKTVAEKKTVAAKKTVAKKTVPSKKAKEVLPKQTAGDKLVKVIQFQVVLNPGTSVAIFWNIAVRNEKDRISSVSVDFAESRLGVVERVYAGSTAQGFREVAAGSVSVAPEVISDDPETSCEAILSGTIQTTEGNYEMFFFTKPVVLEQPDEMAA